MRAFVLTPAVLVAAIATGLPRASAADPTTDRVFAAPTAWLPPAGAIIGTGAVDLRAIAEGRFESTLTVGYGLGGLAALDVGTDADVRGCDLCGDGSPRPLYLGRATFRMGARQNAWFKGMPALLVGTRVSFAASGNFDNLRAVDAYAMASRTFTKYVRVHAGVSVHAARYDEPDRGIELEPALRPNFGIEVTPPQYSRTSVMGDFTYLPLLVRTDTESSARLEWVAGWGVRYQAFDWGAIELAVRHREGEGLGDSTVFVRVNGIRKPKR